MSYNVNGNNMLQWFYPASQPYNMPNNASTTNYKINNVDISNNYIGIGRNSKIPVSQLYSIGYNYLGQSIGNLFELNLPNFFISTINVNFKIWPTNNHNGLLIQFLKSEVNQPIIFGFRYKVNCSFVMVGGGGGGGNPHPNDDGAGGGGAGEVITGTIEGYDPQLSNFTIVIGEGGGARTSGEDTSMTYFGNTITANGGGAGADGKGNSAPTTGSSSGGAGAWSSTQVEVGTVTSRNPLPNTIIFKNMTSYGNQGNQGNNQRNDTGGGGGGGGAGGAAPYPGSDNEKPGIGGAALSFFFGSQQFVLGGGGGGGGRRDGEGPTPQGVGGIGGGVGSIYVGGQGGGPSDDNGGNGFNGQVNTGSGGGGAQSGDTGIGGSGGSGTIIFYVEPSGVYF
jgi:hypothetical protein